MKQSIFIAIVAIIGFSTNLIGQLTPPDSMVSMETFPHSPPENKKTTEDLMNEAIAHFDGGRYPQSLVLLEEALQINKEGRLSDILYYYRGLVYYKLKNYPTMCTSLDTAIAFNSDKAHYYYYRAEAFLNLGELHKAQADYKKTIELAPRYDAAWLKYGILLQQKNQIREALIAYDQAIDINPKNSEAYYYRGLIMLQVGMPDKGCLDLSQAADLNYRPAEKALKQYCAK